jgi:hypothetical protein
VPTLALPILSDLPARLLPTALDLSVLACAWSSIDCLRIFLGKERLFTAGCKDWQFCLFLEAPAGGNKARWVEIARPLPHT